jgi:hypothetical protein
MDANLAEILVGIDGARDDCRLTDHVTKPRRRASLSTDEIEELLRFNHPNRERHRRYVLIDEITGHVWGDVVAADPIKACRAVDARCGQHKREYTDIGSAPFDSHSGYHVYLATDALGDYAGWDGRDGEFIKAVEAMPFVTRVAIEKL